MKKPLARWAEARSCTPAQIAEARAVRTQAGASDYSGAYSVSNSSLTSVLFVLLLLVGLAQLLGALFVKMRQPKVIGEILAGVVLGPALLGRFPAVAGLTQGALHKSEVGGVVEDHLAVEEVHAASTLALRCIKSLAGSGASGCFSG